MPELPEVETIRRELSKELVGLEVQNVVWDDKRLLKPNPEEVKEAIVGKSFESVERRAKLLVFRLTGNVNFLCHLRMSGRLLIRNQDDPKDKYVEVWIKLSEGRELRFANSRKFGYIKLASSEEIEKALKKYGPEPLDDLTVDKFKEILSSTRAMIKSVLMDQKRIAGIGNIYANDALWLAKIHPETPANKLSEKKVEELYQAVEKVLKQGLETKGASDQWYRDAYGKKGSYQQKFKVYGRAGKPCLRDDGGTIQRIKVGGRGTFFCPVCQELRN